MVEFTDSRILGKYKEFSNRFEAPITNGQYYNSTDGDVTLMNQRVFLLREITQSYVQRKGADVLSVCPPTATMTSLMSLL